MASSPRSSSGSSPEPETIHRFKQRQSVDGVRWLPNYCSDSNRRIIIAALNAWKNESSLQTYNFSCSQNSSDLVRQASLKVPSRIKSIKICPNFFSIKHTVAASTRSGSILFCTADSINGSVDLKFTVPREGFHSGHVSGIDFNENGSECLTAGKDGRINLVDLKEKGKFRRIYDGGEVVSYSCVKWSSPMEFVTGGNRGIQGSVIQWWDQRKPGGPVAVVELEKYWKGTLLGSVHCLDINPLRKHTCLAGGSSGTVFACDIRKPKEPAILCGLGVNGVLANSDFNSDIWDIQYDDDYTESTAEILPAMICLEGGILAVIKQGVPPEEILSAHCSIEKFDIDKQNPSDVACATEWGDIVIYTREDLE